MLEADDYRSLDLVFRFVATFINYAFGVCTVFS